NLRATRSKVQYGLDFDYPIARYVEGFTQPFLQSYQAGAKNPLYQDPSCREGSACAPVRDPSLVFWAAIVGVPWQDIAVDEHDLSSGFLDAKGLLDQGRWDLILGDPNASPPVPPTDPHMLVSTAPRPGLPGPDSALNADEKNGHEWDTAADTPSNTDLQY